MATALVSRNTAIRPVQPVDLDGQELDFVFKSENTQLGRFFSKKAMENAFQAHVRCTPRRANKIAAYMRLIQGVDDLVVVQRQCGPLPEDDASWRGLLMEE